MSDQPNEGAEPSSLDGRVQRGARNRERIVEAMLAIVRSGNMQPTAEQVAERAGVGTRTVFRHFDDMDALYSEMSAAIRSEIAPIMFDPVPSGDLAERIRTVAHRRSEVFELIAPFQRAGAVHRWRSVFLRDEYVTLTRNLREQLILSLPELKTADPTVVEAADLLACTVAWYRMRDEQGLDVETARAVVILGLEGLLGVV